MVGVLGLTGIALMLQPAQQTVPPTNAFSQVYINNERITADSYNDILNITTQGMITSMVDENNDSVIITMSEFDCPLFQGITEVDEDGNFVCGVI